MPFIRQALLGFAALATCSLASSISERYHHENLVPRDYATEVCSPNITTSSTTDASTIPPCIEVVTIQILCAPNASSPLEYLNHAECMCGSSYFQDWQGCQDCLYFHGLRTEREEEFYDSVMSIASHSLCDYVSGVSGATEPTAPIASLFSSAAATAVPPTTGATVSSDQAPSQTAVSLYFTLSGSQGLGATAITSNGASSNSALTSATKTSLSFKSTTTSSTGSSAATSSSGSGACLTKAPAGLVLGLAGVAMAAGW